LRPGTIALSNAGTLVNGDNYGYGTITGSTLNFTGASMLEGHGTLTNVTVPAGSDVDFVVSQQFGSTQTLTDTITDDGTIDLTANASHNVNLNYSGTVTLAGTGQLLMHTVPNSGHYPVVQSDGSNSTIINDLAQPMRSVWGFFGYGGTVVNRGTLDADGGGLMVAPDTFTNNGTVLARNGGTLQVFPTPTNFASGTLTGGTWQVFANSTLRVNLNSGIITDAAAIVLDGVNSNFYRDSGTTDALADLTAIASGGSLTIRNGRNFPTAGGLPDLTNSGTLTIGASSMLTVTGNYTQSLNGTLEVELGPASSQFGQLNVTDHATLAGTLDTTLVAPYHPNPGDTFQVLIFDSRTGDFTTKNLYRDDTVALTTSYRTTPDSLDLLAVPAPQHGSPGQPVPVSGQPFPTAPDIGPSILPVPPAPDGEGAGLPMPAAVGGAPGAGPEVERTDSLFWLWAERPEAEAALEALGALVLPAGS
jgi:hypothetical protein